MKIRSLLVLAAATLTAVAASAQPISRNDPNGVYCREYQQEVIVGGKRQSSYGTACMQPDGDWKILPSDVQERAAATTIEYIEEPVFISQPVYMVPPPVYYEPVRYYGHYPSYGYGYGSRHYSGYSGSSFSISFGDDHRYRGRGHHKHRGHGHWKH